MLNRAIFKRVIPFILALAVGLFVASFFVSIIPNFRFKSNACGKRHEIRMMKQENKRLRWENEQLKMRRMNNGDEMILLEEKVPPPPPLAPKSVE